MAFLVFFILVPFIEITLLIQVGTLVGSFNTFALLILMAFVGTLLVRRQGLRTLQQAQLKLAQGQPPNKELLSGIMLFFAGVLFILPGFLSDFFALFLLIPFIRQQAGIWLIQRMRARSSKHFFQQGFHYYRQGHHSGKQHEAQRGQVLDADYEEKVTKQESITEKQPEQK